MTTIKAAPPVETPAVTDDFFADAALEAEYQRKRWGSEHDDRKTDDEWFWTLGYLVGKVLRPDADTVKKRHRLRAAAALLKQWDDRLADDELTPEDETWAKEYLKRWADSVDLDTEDQP